MSAVSAITGAATPGKPHKTTKETPMTPKFHEEWRTINPRNRLAAAHHYDNHADARADAERSPWRIVQKRLVSDWGTE